MDYSKYLKSDHWFDVKERYRESGLSQKCRRCKSPRYHLHHLTYERIGRELLTDLMPLCDPCHRAVHAYSKKHGIPIEETHVILKRMKLEAGVKPRTRRR